jgi:uncharacterized protein (DUF2336 family)
MLGHDALYPEVVFVEVGSSRFAKLIELAREPSSERRRDLLREVSDMFFESVEAMNDDQRALFDDVLRSVAKLMQDEVLRELSVRFADSPEAPRGLLVDLATNVFPVAEPILRRSPVITEDDLLEVVQTRSQRHIDAVASRNDVTERLSDAIVTHGDNTAVATLLRNDQAQMSRDTMEVAANRARQAKDLQEPLIACKAMPIDLLNDMLFHVEQRLRLQILERNMGVDQRTLDDALAASRSRLKEATEVSSEELRSARMFVAQKKNHGELSPTLLVSLYRDRQMTHFLYALSEMTGLDVDTARQILTKRDMDALATACRAADIERPLFVTLAVLICGGERAMGKATQFGELYASVPVEAAQRAMRFFRLRKQSDQAA